MGKVRQFIGNIRGPKGTTFTPHLSQDKDLSFTNDGGLSNPETVSLMPDPATASADGLMSAADKAKLDGIPADATNNAGTITEIRMNGASVSAGGVADLGTVITDVSGKLDASRVGTANGVAELDANGKVPSAQLPAYVDDVLEYASLSAFPESGETGKIYVAVDTNVTYRWGGSAYVVIGSSLALGETSSTAYRGDRGKVAYDHSQAAGNAHNMTKADIGLGNVPNVSTNDQTPTYTAASALAALSSGEKLSVAFGKLAKGVSDLIAHLTDNVRHITAAERTAWNNKVDKAAGKGLSTNDYTTAEKQKLENIESGAQVNEVSAEQYESLLKCVRILGRRVAHENEARAKTLDSVIAGLKSLGVEVEEGLLGWDDFLDICGYKATRTAYASTAAAITGFQNGDVVVIKVDGYPNEYSKACQVPLQGFSGTYYRETYHEQDS